MMQFRAAELEEISSLQALQQLKRSSVAGLLKRCRKEYATALGELEELTLRYEMLRGFHPLTQFTADRDSLPDPRTLITRHQQRSGRDHNEARCRMQISTLQRSLQTYERERKLPLEQLFSLCLDRREALTRQRGLLSAKLQRVKLALEEAELHDSLGARI